MYAYLTNNVKTVHALFLELWFRFIQLFWGEGEPAGVGSGCWSASEGRGQLAVIGQQHKAGHESSELT